MESLTCKEEAMAPGAGAERIYQTSFRCHYERLNCCTQYRQALPLKDISRWIEAYQYTHPGCRSVIVKIPLTNKEVKYEAVSEGTAQSGRLC